MKKNVVVVFGGDSSEHDISCLSAMTVIQNMDKEKYNIILVGITKDGKWLLVDKLKDIEDGSWREGEVRAFISPDTTTRSLVILAEETYKLQKVDVIFPVLHGMNGEDGTIQGLFEMSKIPYVGCGVLASAVSMDKVYTKIIVEKLGVDQAKFVHIRETDFGELDKAMDRVEKEIPYPVFVKPSCAGSSKGVSKAENRKELEAALYEAVKHDRNILVEETIIGREVECAVLGDRKEVKATCVGEILAAADFYDFDAKYNNAESKTVIDPDMPEESKEKIRKDAVEIFKAVDGFGCSRVDFFLEESGRVVFNEINTLPGFTSISMYPMLWKACGLDTPQLIDTLIEQARTRYR
ncbi:MULTISPECIES: D-alanine--D-alanine ligase family protein [Anaerostipes]|uniref:D-alanine--D-alanine ligase family protein n=1 Tax=Anaerostipes TaxID=207244 RepID=UPI000952D80F|nr:MULTISPECIES: D-alanine--D-alanine ligase family protein [Anaerostipes]MCI5622389.1 D-alanine--D-alanine ligase [Anaerostipes sp.]MDY2726886.1 D-alanine--D-alanine ligase family protein [Anaerostipes faecalis]